ncbi:MAG: sulfotransferase [Nitrospirota bacterium]
MRLNKAPIFINGFSYGGTNLLMNFIASHPKVCLLSGETHEIFYSRPKKVFDKWLRRCLYLPIQAAAGRHVFGRRFLHNRNHTPRFVMPYIDLIFYLDKITTSRNRFKAEGLNHNKSGVKKCRFLAKNVNGVVLATGIFAEIYPDATFIALVRNGFSLCEGYIRRGWSAADFGRMYEKVCQKMIRDTDHIRNYHLVRFEDLISDPVAFITNTYGFAGLDLNEVNRFRLQAKRSMDTDGIRKYTFGGSKDREIYWFTIDEIPKYVRKDVNASQLQKLMPEARDIFLQYAGRSMEYLKYI